MLETEAELRRELDLLRPPDLIARIETHLLLPWSEQEAKEAITARGRGRGFVTFEDLLQIVPVEDFTPEQVEEFLTQAEEHLRGEGIEVIDVPAEEFVETAAAAPLDVDLLKAPTNDPVRMYLKEIGKVPPLMAAQEVDLARRIEAGEFAAELSTLVASGGKLDHERLRTVVESVVGIRDYQLDRFGRIEGIGRDRISESYKPKTREDLEDFLRRVERDGQLAKKKLIEANLRVVVSIAKRHVGRGIQFLDLIQEGNSGLIRAVEKFDYSEGHKFSTFAAWWIRVAITRAIADPRRTIRIRVHMVQTMNKLVRIKRQLLQDLGRDPTPEEIGRQMGIPADRVRQILKVSQEPVSLEAPIGEDEDSHLGDFIEDSDVVPVDVANFILLQEQIESVLHALSEREKKVIQLRFGLLDGHPRTLEEVGREFGVTRERIRQIESKTLSKLRHPSRSQKLGDQLDELDLDEPAGVERRVKRGGTRRRRAVTRRLLIEYLRTTTEADSGFPRLTRREEEVLKLAAKGLTYGEIGRKLAISTKTVRNHLQNVITKLQLRGWSKDLGDPGAGEAGVREPRRPRPPAGSGTASLPEPERPSSEP